jgi:hypothetical protein
VAVVIGSKTAVPEKTKHQPIDFITLKKNKNKHKLR